MRMHIGLKSALAGAVLVTSACALLEPQAERYVPPPAGTTYERDIRATGSFGKSYRETSKYAGMRQVMGRPMHVHERSTGQSSMLVPEGGWIGEFKGEKPIFTFDPPLSVGYPIKVGKTASRDVRITFHAANRTVPFKASWKVEAYEDVTVPAGTFKAFRISYKDTAGNERTSWMNPENGIFVKWSALRTAKHSQGPGTQDAELVKVNLPR